MHIRRSLAGACLACCAGILLAGSGAPAQEREQAPAGDGAAREMSYNDELVVLSLMERMHIFEQLNLDLGHPSRKAYLVRRTVFPPAMLAAGDYVVIDTALSPENGSMVVALRQGMLILRKFTCEGSNCFLRSPDDGIDASGVTIIGVVTHLQRAR